MEKSCKPIQLGIRGHYIAFIELIWSSFCLFAHVCLRVSVHSISDSNALKMTLRGSE